MTWESCCHSLDNTLSALLSYLFSVSQWYPNVTASQAAQHELPMLGVFKPIFYHSNLLPLGELFVVLQALYPLSRKGWP